MALAPPSPPSSFRVDPVEMIAPNANFNDLLDPRTIPALAVEISKLID